MALERETQVYRHELQKLLEHEGQFVVISGESILGVFGTYEDALKAGYEKCGLKEFLVKQIEAVEQVRHFSRNVDLPCPS